jgi:uncharacterized protein (TIGR02118 family)
LDGFEVALNDEAEGAMIAMIACAKRKADMSLAEFNRYWIDKHAPLVRSVPEFMRHVRKYVQFHCDPHRPQGAPFGGSVDFDGVGELWFDSLESMQTAFAEPRYLEVIRPDESKFLDLERCIVFITHEWVIHDELSGRKESGAAAGQPPSRY